MSRFSVALTLAAVLSCSAAVQASPPWISLVPFKKVDADSKKTYTLTKANGPWMIMAMSFSGDEAETQARKLVLELRRDHKLEAWMHEQVIDLEESVEGLGVNERGKPKKMKYLHGAGSSEIAVLVGNFRSFDDPDATRMLETIRYVKPKSLSGGSLAQKSGMRIRDAYRLVSQGKDKVRGPLGRAFITRNPMLPVDEVARESLDPFVEELNEGLEYSLLKNPGRYTVVIATYRGAASYSEEEFKKSFQKNGSQPKLDEAARNAIKVTAELRKQGIEAYEFHDRHESLVTVGSFNEVGQEMADGHIELRPEIAAIIKRFEAQKASNLAAIPAGQVGLIPKAIAKIPLDVSPRLIMVPKKSLADVYRQRASLR